VAGPTINGQALSEALARQARVNHLRSMGAPRMCRSAPGCAIPSLAMTGHPEEAWWKRDIDFPNFWRYYPLILIACLIVSALLAAFVWNYLVFAGPLLLLIICLYLWGPRGRLRRE
jgi:hypothetical protein